MEKKEKVRKMTAIEENHCMVSLTSLNTRMEVQAHGQMSQYSRTICDLVYGMIHWAGYAYLEYIGYNKIVPFFLLRILK